MGRESETQWEEPHLKDTSKRRNREEHASLVSWVRKTSYFTFAWCSMVYKTQTPAHGNLTGIGEASTLS